MPREKVLCGKEKIIRVAVRVVDTEGIGALSARRIAKELGISPMTLYNYVENLQEIEKHVLTSGFDRLYDSIYHALNSLEPPVDKFLFCKTLAKQVFSFAMENRNIFSFMQSNIRSFGMVRSVLTGTTPPSEVRTVEVTVRIGCVHSSMAYCFPLGQEFPATDSTAPSCPSSTVS